MDEVTATPEAGVEQSQEVTTSSQDAELLSAFLAEEDHSHDGIEAASTDDEQEPTDNADVFTVKINGTEKQVTRDELITRYQKDESSDQKFQEAANLRREAEQQTNAALQERNNLQAAVNNFAQIAQQWAAQGQPDWAYLLENNPHEYLQQKAIHESRQIELNKAQAAQNYLNQQYQLEQQQQVTQHLEREGARLLDIIPEWKDTAIRTRDEQALVKFMTEEGYTHEEMQNLNHSKASNIKLVRDAMLYRQLVSTGVSKQVKGLPPRVERPGVSNSRSDGSGLAEAKQRLGRSGSIADATDAFSAMFS